MLIDQRTLDDARRFNRLLALAPRFKVTNRITPRIGQALLRLSQIGADWRLRRRGLRVEHPLAKVDGASVPVRVVRPAVTPRAVVLDIHGGGWAIGNPQMNDALNAAIVRACGVAVVSVDYRLATSATIEEIIGDCTVAARWLLGDGLPDLAHLPVIVVGESAGAHLALAALQRLQDSPALLARVIGAVLYYGVYDLAGTPSVHGAGPDTLVLDGPGMAPAMRMLTPGLDDAARRHPSLSPLYGSLAGMPPVLLYAGERDPLRDDTVLLAQRWREHAPVDLHRLPEAPHGFIHFPVLMGKVVCAHTHAWIDQQLARHEAAATAIAAKAILDT